MLGRGSSLPGYIAKKIKPNLLAEMTFPETVIMVTGTNGKTSVTHDLVNMFRQAGHTVVTNGDGANITQGILTASLKDASVGGKIKSDMAIFEVDEGFLPHIVKQIKPTHLIINNLFQDQVDRFGSAHELAIKMHEGIPEGVKIYGNGDDPIVTGITQNLENEVKYFGVRGETSEGNSEETCPVCQNKLHYNFVIYDHIGDYYCDCGFKHPELDIVAENIDDRDGCFSLHGEELLCRNNAIYFIYNGLAAAAVAYDFNIPMDIIRKVLREVETVPGRMEKIVFHDKETYLNLIKNPAGANMSLNYADEYFDDEYVIFMAINNDYADGRDITWLNDLDFSAPDQAKIKGFYVTGSCHRELARIIRERTENVPVNTYDTVEEAFEALDSVEEVPFFLANYTTLKPVIHQLEKRESKDLE